MFTGDLVFRRVGGESRAALCLHEPDAFSHIEHFRAAADADPNADAGEVFRVAPEPQHGCRGAHGVVFDVKADVLDAAKSLMDAPAA